MIPVLDPVARAAWHPVGFCRDFEEGTLRPVSVLGEELVIWRGTGGWRVWQDLCLHRGVKLSLGRVMEGCALRCAYHGWTYGEDGRCLTMPAHPSLKPPEKARVRAYPCREQGGLVWVGLDDPNTDPPHLPESEEPAFRAVPCGPYPCPAGAPRLIENFLDVAHLPIVHDGALGVTDQAEILPYEVDWMNGLPLAREIRIFQPNPDGRGDGGLVTYEYGILAPFTVYLRKHLPDGGRFSLLLAVTPVSETESVAWFLAFLNGGDPARDAEVAAFQEHIFAQDQPIVASQRPERLPLNLAEELHLPSDRLAIAYRKYLRSLGLSFGTA